MRREFIDDSLVIEETPLASRKLKFVPSTPTPSRGTKSFSLSTKVGPWDFSQAVPKRTRIWKYSGHNSDILATEIEDQLSKMGGITLESSGTQIPFSQAPIETSTPIVAQENGSVEITKDSAPPSIPTDTTNVSSLTETLQRDSIPKNSVATNVTINVSIDGLNKALAPNQPVASDLVSSEYNFVFHPPGTTGKNVKKIILTLEGFTQGVGDINSIVRFLIWLETNFCVVNLTKPQWDLANTTINRIKVNLKKGIEARAAEIGIRQLTQTLNVSRDEVSFSLKAPFYKRR